MPPKVLIESNMHVLSPLEHLGPYSAVFVRIMHALMPVYLLGKCHLYSRAVPIFLVLVLELLLFVRKRRLDEFQICSAVFTGATIGWARLLRSSKLHDLGL